jgi:hypothetical protein
MKADSARRSGGLSFISHHIRARATAAYSPPSVSPFIPARGKERLAKSVSFIAGPTGYLLGPLAKKGKRYVYLIRT